MTRVLKIIALVGAIMLALGVMLAVAGFAFGGSRYLYEYRNGGNIPGWGMAYTEIGPEAESTVETEPFGSIRVEGPYIELNVRRSEDEKYAVETVCSTGIKPPDYTVENEQLEIISNWPRNMKNHGNETYRVTIYYPQSRNLNTVSIDLSACELSFRECGAKNMEIRAAAADVEIIDSEFGRFELNNAAGDVYIKDTTADTASISLNMGDLDAGHFDTAGLDVKVNMGDVDLSGALREKSTVAVNMGEVDLAPTLSPDLYYVKVHGTMENRAMGASTAPYVIEVNADLGHASVELED